MSNEYNVYCDESCHLENDGQEAMVLGCVWSPKEKTKEINVRLREIKEKHGVSSLLEVKWTKVSPGKLSLYRERVDYFFDDDDLHFRGLIIPDKQKLNHKKFNQDHDLWYYKMYFDLLKVILNPDSQYRVYIDIKDTNGGDKIRSLHDVLSNNMYDFSKKVIERIQLVRSHELEQLQIADLLIGGLAYASRGLNGSNAKLNLVDRIRERSGYSLTKSTLLREEKFNLLYWRAAEDSHA